MLGSLKVAFALEDTSYMAFSAVWIALASLLYCFDIQKAKVGEGNT
jgi:hypothetical protein